MVEQPHNAKLPLYDDVVAPLPPKPVPFRNLYVFAITLFSGRLFVQSLPEIVVEPKFGFGEGLIVSPRTMGLPAAVRGG